MLPRKESCDLLIVGGSFAGLVAARTAAMCGLDVVVLEAKPDAGARVATTGILVKESAEEIDIPRGMTRCVHGVRLYAPSLRLTRCGSRCGPKAKHDERQRCSVQP